MIKRLLLIFSLFAPCGAYAAWHSVAQQINGCSVNCMITPIMSFAGATSANPSNSANNFAGMTGGSGGNGAFTATLADHQVPMPVAGTFSNLEAHFATTIASGAGATCNGVSEPSPCYTLGFNYAGNLATLGCNVFNGTQSCSDSTNSVLVAPGDLVAWEVLPVGTPTVQALPLQVGATFTSTVGQESPIFGGTCAANVSNTVVNYLSFGTCTAANATEANVSSVIPAAGVIDQLYMALNGAAGASATYTTTIYHGGSATSLTCVTAANGSTCKDTAHNFAVAAGDTISISSCPSNTATCPAGSVPTTRRMQVGVRFVPTTLNQAVLMTTNASLPATNATRFLPLNGTSNGDGTEANTFNISPVLGTHMTISGLQVKQDVAPGGVTTRTINLREGTGGGQSTVGTPGNVSCVVTSAATTCSDVTNTYAATSGVFLNLQTTVSGTDAALAYFKTGVIVTVP